MPSSKNDNIDSPDGRKLYCFMTKPGTDLETFNNYINTLPDRGNGLKSIRPYSFQAYVTNLTVNQAEGVAEQPFMQSIKPFGGRSRRSAELREADPCIDEQTEEDEGGDKTGESEQRAVA